MRSIIVIGYHRSGTSYVASILDHLGVDMGINRSRDPDRGNPEGYFENSEFVRANQRLLEKGEMPNIKKIYTKNKGELWGAKDPRFIDTLKIWKHLFEDLHVIIVTRDPIAIAQSVCFQDDGKYSPKKIFTDVIRDVFNYYCKVPRLMKFNHFFYSFEQRPNKELAEFLGLPYKEEDIFKPDLKHF